VSVLGKKLIQRLVVNKTLEKSLIHPSYDNKSNNDVLEFLGDSVLQVKVTEILVKRMGKSNKVGPINEKRNSIVSNVNLFKAGLALGLDHYLKYKNLSAPSVKMIADCFEAILGELQQKKKEHEIACLINYLVNFTFSTAEKAS
jgi:dsRNA-specific ribonuclease